MAKKVKSVVKKKSGNPSNDFQLNTGQAFLSIATVLIFNLMLQWFNLEFGFEAYPRYRIILLYQPLLFFSIIFGVSILYSKMNKADKAQTTKAVILFSPILIFGLIIDSLGHHSGLSRSYEKLADYLADKAFFRNILILDYLSVGIIISLVIGFLVFMFFCLVNSKSFLKTVVGIVAYPLLIIALCALPPVISKKILFSGSNSTQSDKAINVQNFLSFTSQEKSTMLVSGLILFLLAAVWYSIRNRIAFRSLVKNLRILRIVHYSFMLTFGAILYFHIADSQIHLDPASTVKLIAGYLTVILAWMTVVIVNDKYDFKGDKAQKLDRPLVSGKIELDEFITIAKVYFFFSLFFACIIGFSFFLINAALIGLAYCYSAPPLRIKKIPFLATLTLATCNLFITFMGYIIFSPTDNLSGYPFGIMLLIWIVFSLSNNSKDIRDYEGDKRDGVITLPTLLGLRLSKIVIGALMAFSYLLVPVFLKINILYPVAIVMGLITFWLMNRKEVKDLYFFLCYFIFFLIIMVSMVLKIS